MLIRDPVVAGQFYPASGKRCREELEALLERCVEDGGASADVGLDLVGGLVPHAGWICSGAIAARVFQALAARRSPTVIVLFGGVHRYRGKEAAMFGSGRWNTPLGGVEVDARLAERVLGHTNLIVEDPYAHEAEHSLEVQIPFIQRLFPDAQILPVMVPITERAHEVGDAVGRTLTAYAYDALVVGTTDLTHYGPRYGFIPHGVGAQANQWAKEENDRRFLDLVCHMSTNEFVPEATKHHNACSSGAVAATSAAATALGATGGILLEHSSSAEVLHDLVPGEQTDSVGYAGVVFAK